MTHASTVSGPDGDAIVVRVEHVVKRFTGATAVDGVSFDVRAGEVFALLGPNGAGKSTLVRMVCGILLPDEGRIFVTLDGRSSSRIDPRRLGYLPEDRGLYPDAPVLRTIAYLGTLRGLERDDAAARAERWLARFDLADRTDVRIDSLSKGNQQKVQFISSIVHDPDIAVLDEPFSGFDPINQDLVLQLIRELRSSGTTVILSAHHMDLVETLADRILLLHRGREVLAGTLEDVRVAAGAGRHAVVAFASAPDPDGVRSLPGVAAVRRVADDTLRVELVPGETVGALLRRLTGLGTVTDVATGETSLRELYLRAVGGDADAADGPDARPAGSVIDDGDAEVQR